MLYKTQMANEYLTAAIYGMKRFNEWFKRIINMEKLDELLKEYQLSKWEWVRLAWPDVEVSDKEELVLEATLISKKYWFIKWLVENEKIDREKNELAFSFSSVYTYDGEDFDNHLKLWKLLILLSIQDEPIEFLVSILK